MTEEEVQKLEEQLEQLEPDNTFIIEGIREETYIGQMCEWDGDFKYYPAELQRHVICCTRDNDTHDKYEITLYTTYEGGGSVQTADTFGHMDVKKVEEFAGMTHTADFPMSFDLHIYGGNLECLGFEFSLDGGDSYYPRGGYSINQEWFTELPKDIQKDDATNSEQSPVENTSEENRSEIKDYKANPLPTSEPLKNLSHSGILEDFDLFISTSKRLFDRPKLVMRDGTNFSVQEEAGRHFVPSGDESELSDLYEIAYPSAIIEQLGNYDGRTFPIDETMLESVFPCVPKDVVLDILEQHGGIDITASLHPKKRLAGLHHEKVQAAQELEEAIDAYKSLAAIASQLDISLGDDEPNSR